MTAQCLLARMHGILKKAYLSRGFKIIFCSEGGSTGAGGGRLTGRIYC